MNHNLLWGSNSISRDFSLKMCCHHNKIVRRNNCQHFEIRVPQFFFRTHLFTKLFTSFFLIFLFSIVVVVVIIKQTIKTKQYHDYRCCLYGFRHTQLTDSVTIYQIFHYYYRLRTLPFFLFATCIVVVVVVVVFALLNNYKTFLKKTRNFIQIADAYRLINAYMSLSNYQWFLSLIRHTNKWHLKNPVTLFPFKI